MDAIVGHRSSVVAPSPLGLALENTPDASTTGYSPSVPEVDLVRQAARLVFGVLDLLDHRRSDVCRTLAPEAVTLTRRGRSGSPALHTGDPLPIRATPPMM